MAEGGRLGQRLACEAGRVVKDGWHAPLGIETYHRRIWVVATHVAVPSGWLRAQVQRWTCSSFDGALPSRLVARLRETAHVASLPIGLEAQHGCALLM